MSMGNENFICGPLVPEEVRHSVGWQSMPYAKFRFSVNALRSVAHVLPFEVRPLYLECGSDLDLEGRELSRRLLDKLHNDLLPQRDIPERRKFFMRVIGKDPDQQTHPWTFPDRFQGSRGEAANTYAVSASNGADVVKTIETLIEFAGENARNYVDLIKRESPRFSQEDYVKDVRASVVAPSGYIQKILPVAEACAEYDTYFLSWWV